MASTKRRLAFAAPFVVTALAAPGCSHPAPKQPSPDTAPDATPVDQDDAPGPAPEGAGTWSKPDGRWVFTYTDEPGTKIYIGDDRTCWIESTGCPPVADDDAAKVVSNCNPPPPQDVQCPPGLPADAAK